MLLPIFHFLRLQIKLAINSTSLGYNTSQSMLCALLLGCFIVVLVQCSSRWAHNFLPGYIEQNLVPVGMFKISYNLGLHKYYFIYCNYFIFQIQLSSTGGRLILCSDGVWDALTSEMAFDFSRALPPETAANKVVKVSPSNLCLCLCIWIWSINS